jgi:hypothetical protein
MDSMKVECDRDGESCEMSGGDLIEVNEEKEPVSDFSEFKTESAVSCMAPVSGDNKIHMDM